MNMHSPATTMIVTQLLQHTTQHHTVTMDSRSGQASFSPDLQGGQWNSHRTDVCVKFLIHKQALMIQYQTWVVPVTYN